MSVGFGVGGSGGDERGQRKCDIDFFIAIKGSSGG